MFQLWGSSLDKDINMNFCTLRLNYPDLTQELQQRLAHTPTEHGNITFICAKNERIVWDGLPYLATMSDLLHARSGEEQHFTLMLPDIEASLMKKLLLLLTSGSVDIVSGDQRQIWTLAALLRVSVFKIGLSHFLVKWCSSFQSILTVIRVFFSMPLFFLSDMFLLLFSAEMQL